MLFGLLVLTNERTKMLNGTLSNDTAYENKVTQICTNHFIKGILKSALVSVNSNKKPRRHTTLQKRVQIIVCEL